ncbi:MAG: nucleotidyltransferase family protein [Acidobacteria bacterium]|nr:nucleotidyltransferase family protein [Acidobacteriota bacterium]
MADLEAVLADLAQRLEKAGIEYMVIGGLANAVWGSPRSTIDIDCTVVLDPARAGELLETLGPAYQSRTSDPEGFVARTRVLPLRHRGGVQIDLIFAMLPFEEEAVRRAVEVAVKGTPVRFCTPEDLVLHKIVSQRERDRQDVEDILRRRRSTLDRSYLDPRVHELAVLLERPQLEAWYLELMDG